MEESATTVASDRGADFPGLFANVFGIAVERGASESAGIEAAFAHH